MSLQDIKNVVRELPKSDQAELIHFLTDLLADDSFILTKEWKEELATREEALKNGDSIGRLAKDVLAKYTSK